MYRKSPSYVSLSSLTTSQSLMLELEFLPSMMTAHPKSSSSSKLKPYEYAWFECELGWAEEGTVEDGIKIAASAMESQAIRRMGASGLSSVPSVRTPSWTGGKRVWLQWPSPEGRLSRLT